ncbi:hypothetical protein [Pectobacterium brasiliense]|uniref:hypothetical protein n=1 Tax=Pectobacterium brasiliense TaxID=180957 RepID=UPI0032EEB1EE
MQCCYPENSLFSLFNRDKSKDISYEVFLSHLETDFPNHVAPDSIKALKNKVTTIIGKDKNLDDLAINKYQLQICMHFCYMMDIESRQWGQSKGWWHIPFTLNSNNPLNTIEDYRHSDEVYRSLLQCKKMLNNRIDLLDLMYEIESKIMDFLVFFPRSMYDFYDSKIKMYSGQYEAAIVLVHLIHQLNLDKTITRFYVNGIDEFCKIALTNEAIKNAKYFIEESKSLDDYDIEMADVDYIDLIGDQCKPYDDNTLIERVCSYFDHKKMKLNITKNMIDTVIFIQCLDRRHPLFEGTEEQFYQKTINHSHVRYAAICLLVKADKKKSYFSSNKTGGNNKKIHIINNLKTITNKFEKELDFNKKIKITLEMDYSFMKFISYYMNCLISTIEYETPAKEGIKEYREVRKHKWSLIEMLYTTLGNAPLEHFKYMLNSLSEQIDKWKWSSDTFTKEKEKARNEYVRMKENGEYDKL